MGQLDYFFQLAGSLAPLVEQLYVFLLDIASLQSLCHYVLIVGQSNQLYVSISKKAFSAIGKP